MSCGNACLSRRLQWMCNVYFAHEQLSGVGEHLLIQNYCFWTCFSFRLLCVCKWSSATELLSILEVDTNNSKSRMMQFVKIGIHLFSSPCNVHLAHSCQLFFSLSFISRLPDSDDEIRYWIPLESLLFFLLLLYEFWLRFAVFHEIAIISISPKVKIVWHFCSVVSPASRSLNCR